MRKAGRYLCYLLLILMISCSPARVSTVSPVATESNSLADGSLEEFLTDLHEGNYDAAAEIYGGSYEDMINDNPDIDPGDHARLLERACTVNGYQCLEVKSIKQEGESSENGTLFTVEFKSPDGSLFVRGPCCGGDETSSPSRSDFQFTVISTENGGYKILEMPPYVP